MHLLDSNICIAILNGDPEARQRIRTLGARTIGLPSIVVAELAYGAWKSQSKSQALAKIFDLIADHRVVDFDEAAAQQYGRIRAALHRTGQLIGPNDLLIAAIALAHDATLVTRNVREFARVDGLKIETI
jgi:tRNA(fMet)-specific endonuclease VapC